MKEHLGRRKRTFEDSVVHSDLCYWGYWKGRQYAADGSSPINTLSQILSGVGGQPGHKVLCLDMKPRAWQINAKVFSLPSELREVLVGRYCLPVKENGQPYKTEEIAPLLRITPRGFYKRLAQARQAYTSMVFEHFAPPIFVINC